MNSMPYGCDLGDPEDHQHANMRFVCILLQFLAGVALTLSTLVASAAGKPAAYLFAHMTVEDYGRLYYSVSTNGLHWRLLNGGKRILPEYRGHPDLARGHDGRWVRHEDFLCDFAGPCHLQPARTRCADGSLRETMTIAEERQHYNEARADHRRSCASRSMIVVEIPGALGHVYMPAGSNLVCVLAAWTGI